jgi:hypothetical protein
MSVAEWIVLGMATKGAIACYADPGAPSHFPGGDDRAVRGSPALLQASGSHVGVYSLHVFVKTELDGVLDRAEGSSQHCEATANDLPGLTYGGRLEHALPLG